MSTNIEFLHADQIGGCVTLISIDTTKICIDFGENLPGSKHKEELEVEGLISGEQQYDAVFFTHYRIIMATTSGASIKYFRGFHCT